MAKCMYCGKETGDRYAMCRKCAEESLKCSKELLEKSNEESKRGGFDNTTH